MSTLHEEQHDDDDVDVDVVNNDQDDNVEACCDETKSDDRATPERHVETSDASQKEEAELETSQVSFFR